MSGTEPRGIAGEDFAQAAALVASWSRPVLLTHARPDGDAIGALVATARVLGRRGREPLPVVFGEVPRRYRFLDQESYLGRRSALIRWQEGKTETALEAGDGVLVLDTCAWGQLEPAAGWLRRTDKPVVVVDHHRTRDGIGSIRLIDESAAATCVVLWEWFTAAGWEVDGAAATALLTGVATDTGWFQHANADARTLATAARLLQAGAESMFRLYERLYRCETMGRFRLRQEVLARTQLLAGGHVAVIALPREVFPRCGAELSETEDLINEPLRLETVRVSVMLVEQEEGLVRIGLRSKPPLGAGEPDIDVSVVAAALGGGGHRRAAGARCRGSLSAVRERVLQALARCGSSEADGR